MEATEKAQIEFNAVVDGRKVAAALTRVRYSPWTTYPESDIVLQYFMRAKTDGQIHLS